MDSRNSDLSGRASISTWLEAVVEDLGHDRACDIHSCSFLTSECCDENITPNDQDFPMAIELLLE